MEKNIIVVGIPPEIYLAGKEAAAIINVEESRNQSPFKETTPIIITNPQAKKHIDKPFVCKGRHEYRLVNTKKVNLAGGTLVTEIWKCKCGKILGS